MSTWKERWKAAPQTVAATVNAIVRRPTPARPTRRRDPFYNEAERWAAVNAGSDGGGWIVRRPDWFRCEQDDLHRRS